MTVREFHGRDAYDGTDTGADSGADVPRPDQTPAAIASDDLDGGGRYLTWPTSVLGSAGHTRSSVPYSSGPTKVR